jgi:hypothetical protein
MTEVTPNIVDLYKAVNTICLGSWTVEILTDGDKYIARLLKPGVKIQSNTFNTAEEAQAWANGYMEVN